MDEALRKISDLQLASYLLAKEYRLLAVEGEAGRRDFVFAGVPDAVIFEFYSGTTTVSPRKLFDAYRSLKGLTLQRL